MYTHKGFYIVSHVPTHVWYLPTLAPKDLERCAFFPSRCTSVDLWTLKDFDAEMIT